MLGQLALLGDFCVWHEDSAQSRKVLGCSGLGHRQGRAQLFPDWLPRAFPGFCALIPPARTHSLETLEPGPQL